MGCSWTVTFDYLLCFSIVYNRSPKLHDHGFWFIIRLIKLTNETQWMFGTVNVYWWIWKLMLLFKYEWKQILIEGMLLIIVRKKGISVVIQNSSLDWNKGSSRLCGIVKQFCLPPCKWSWVACCGILWRKQSKGRHYKHYLEFSGQFCTCSIHRNICLSFLYYCIPIGALTLKTILRKMSRATAGKLDSYKGKTSVSFFKASVGFLLANLYQVLALA